MKLFQSKSGVLLSLCVVLILSSCSKGSSSSSSSSGNNAGALAGTPVFGAGDYFISLGGGTFENTSTGQIEFGTSLAGGNYYLPGAGTFVPGGGGIGFSHEAATKDVDLQNAQFTEQDQNDRAQDIVNQFQTSFDSALQLVQIADKARKMSAQGQMTAEDRKAVTEAALAVAGLTPEDVNQAVEQSQKGDLKAANDLIESAAQNLGMPSSAAIRDQLMRAMAFQSH